MDAQDAPVTLELASNLHTSVFVAGTTPLGTTAPVGTEVVDVETVGDISF